MTIWVFVVLILTQSYNASLASLLTVQKLQPTVANVSQLIRSGDNVGYLEASFVHGLLISLGFNESQLKVYKSINELEKAFSNDTIIAREGIAAAFDENPYMNLFLRKFCSKYTMIDPTFKTDGFGFVSLSNPNITFSPFFNFSLISFSVRDQLFSTCVS